VIDTATLRRPARLRTGDRLAAVTLSWGGPGTFPHRYEAGVRQLEAAFAVEVVPAANAMRDADWIARNPAARADDLMVALADPDIAGIVATIGGEDSIRTLRFLDLDVVRANPKVFVGFSDSTITHCACLRAGVTSFYGPSIMAGLGENTGPFPYLLDGVRRTLFEPEHPLVWPENRDGWTVEHLDWADPTLQETPRALTPASGWRWHGGRRAEGPIVAGCLEALEWLRGTEWFPDLEGAVLAIETSEEGPPPAHVARFLRTMAVTGTLGRLAAVVFGRPGGTHVGPEEHEAYDAAILEVVRDEEGLAELPIVTGVDFGHTDPAWTIPIGVPTRVDPEARTVTFLEAGVR
jgi:muramoyltetrapeptide carboxypeptidase LdcA involved in peptidoglycan recycling